MRVPAFFRPTEPIFNLPCPLLFAHRGGAMEVEESTAKGFRYALEEARADVLELDVQLTSDGEFVVWHGPDLDNVRIEGQPDRPTHRSRRGIHEFRWKELERAWVAGPEIHDVPLAQRDLSDVPASEDTRLLLLSELLSGFPSVALNIEMKETFRHGIEKADSVGLKENVRAFSRILEKEAGKRTIVVAGASDDTLQEFRGLNGDRYATALSIREQLLLRFFDMELSNRCLETSFRRYASSKALIRKVRHLGGSSFVFLTPFGWLFPAMDRTGRMERDKLFEILDRGVDGIMSDRPKQLRGLIDDWKRSRLTEQGIPLC